MTERQLVLAIFPNEEAADSAAEALKEFGLTDGDAVGVLALDEDGKLKEDKIGARSTGKGAGIGACLFLLGPAALGVGVIGGAAVGALHHKGLRLSDEDKQRISTELTAGKAAVGVLAPAIAVDTVSDRLTQLGGTPESFPVSDEKALQVAAAQTPTA